jgi:hypothetical protein
MSDQRQRRLVEEFLADPNPGSTSGAGTGRKG